MNFEKIEIKDWQQFAQVDIAFHPRVTIITGSNGSGKTTILSLLAKHRGWHHTFLATPKSDPVSKILKYFSISRYFGKKSSSDRSIGSILYSNKVSSSLGAPDVDGAQYDVTFSNQQAVDFFYIPSHRERFSYHRLTQFSTSGLSRNEAFEQVQSNSMSRYQGQGFGGQSSAALMKSTLISWLVNGYGVHTGTKYAMLRNPQLIKNFEGFCDALKKILPSSIGFDDIEVRDSEIVFCCNGGNDDFLLETASGGISALIDISWQIYMFDSEKKESYAVVIDEIENHLHPSMQRLLLPSLIAAFPNARFIVSTHSPLVVTSVESSHVYALKYDASKKVRSHLLDFNNDVQNAVEVLDDVLGVSTTLPPWAVSRLEKIIERHSQFDPTSQSLQDLRHELINAGLGRLFPQAITKIADSNK